MSRRGGPSRSFRPPARAPSNAAAAAAAAAAAVALALVLAACSTAPTTSPSPTGPAATPTAPAPTPTGTPRPATAVLLAEIRAAVAQIRGLQPTADVEPIVIDEATLRVNLEAEFDAENSPERLAEAEGFLITLGLLPDGASLRALNLDLLSGQVAGYYSPDRGELYVVSRSGGVGPVEFATYAHEFTHQLQDQHFDLDALGLDATDQGDRSLGVLALVEGDATLAQSTWMQEALTPEELGEILRASLDPAGLEVLRRAPAILRETALFPYRDGFTFVNALWARGGFQAVNAAFASPPDSTEQILHPEKYLSREAPIQVDAPDGLADQLGAGWREVARDTLGEQVLRIWLREGGLSASEARAGADGWGGDRAILFGGPDGETAVLIASEWDDVVEANEFADAAGAAISELGLVGRIAFTERGPAVWIAIGEEAVRLLPRWFG